MANNLPRIVLKKDDATEVEVFLHGATVTSWKCKGSEVLFVSKQAVLNGKKAIRGGIPVVFPNFGPWDFGPQHGFARTENWKVHKNPYQDDSGNIVAVLLLEDNEKLRKIWNYKFKVWYTLTLKDNEFSMELKVENTGDKPFEFTALLHTYYKVNSIDTMKIQGLKGCCFIDKVKGGEHEENSEYVQISRNVDSIYKSTSDEHTLFTGHHNIQIKKENFPDTVIWNPWEEKAKQMSDFGDDEYVNMVCVEPGYVASPCNLQPEETFQAKQVLTCLC